MKTITTSIAALLLLTGCDNAQTSAPQRPLPEVGIVTLMSQPVSVVSELTGRTAGEEIVSRIFQRFCVGK